MIVVSAADAYRQLLQNVRAKTFNIPGKDAVGQYVEGGIFPIINPAYKLNPDSKIFTIGSCFAREVEYVLQDAHFDVPVSRFEIPKEELPYPGPHLLNEYNAGTIIQRLEAVTGLFDYTGKGIEHTEKGDVDLFLHIGSAPVSPDRLALRRLEIDRLYRELLTSDVVVITLGLVESWYDRQGECYLNRAPSQKLVRAEEGRFEFHRMDVDDVHSRIGRAIDALIAMGLQHILLTVSPVPMEATFMPDACVIANGYSKAVLRVCAELMAKKFPEVTYFPSFEIVNSFGTTGLLHDNVHVQPWVVHHIMHYLMHNFVEGADRRRGDTSGASEIPHADVGIDEREPDETSVDLKLGE